MIADELEYQVTRREAERFAAALAQAEQSDDGRDPQMQAILKRALASQLEDLRCELAEYEARRAAEVNASSAR